MLPSAPSDDPPNGTPPGSGSGLLSGSGQIAAAMMVFNLGTYGFTMVTARIIGPESYGAFFSLMNLMLIVGVLSLGLQATAARRVAARPGHAAAIEHAMLRVGFRATLVLGSLLLLATPAIDWLLDLDNLPMAALAAVAAVPLTMMGAQAGILQGERRWRELAVFYVLSGVPRFVIGLGLILWQPTEFMAFLGVTVGYAVPYAYAHWALHRTSRDEPAEDGPGTDSPLRETFTNSQALLAYFALTNGDMVLARTVLDGLDSGLYAAGLIVARAVLFLPQFVVVIAFPAMSEEENRARALTRSLALVALLGAACTAATAALPGLALVFAGGGAYDEVRPLLWVFALLGTVMAMLHLLVYSVLARQGRLSFVLVWIALAAMVVIGLGASTVSGLLAVVLGVQAVLLVALVAVSYVSLRKDGSRAPAQ